MSATVSPSSERLALGTILLLGAFLRLWQLDVAPGFSGDEGLDLYYAWQVAEHHVLSLHPVRPYLGAGQLWFAAPFVALLDVGPLAIRMPAVLLSLLAVGLAWAIGRRLGGARVGLWSGLLMATLPFSVLMARLGLSVSTTPFWCLLVLWLLLRLLDRPGALRAAALGLAVGGAVSFHPQGLLLGPVSVVIALLLPAGRRLARRPDVLAAGAAGFCGTAWLVWELILDQVGLGPGVDYSGTWVGQATEFSLSERLLHSFPQMLDGLVGGRFLHWIAGPSSMDPPGELLASGLAVVVVLAALGALRGRPVAQALVVGVAVAWLLTVVKSADFYLGGLTRERYLLSTLSLGVPALALAAVTPRWRRGGEGALALLVFWNLAALGWGFFAPMATTGGDAEPSFRAGHPDGKVLAAEWMLDRLGPDEEGLLLAGDGWSYWPLVSLGKERFPADFVPKDPEQCAAILNRTDHRRRWLVDYPGWHWTVAIQRCLAAAGAPGLQPAFVPLTVGGAPALHVWELAPGALGR